MFNLQLLLSFQSFDVIPQTQLLEEKRPTGLYRKVHHYYSNILPLLMFIVDMLDEYRRSRKFDARDFVRIRLDIEKLFSDIRSLLDALYKWLICYQPDSQIRGKKRESAGKFADWFDSHNPPPPLDPPASIFSEVVPWLQTVRALRDGYMHHGQESSVFLGDGELYFVPRLRWGRVAERSMPDVFYVQDNPNNLVYLERFLVYLVAPVFALRNALGGYFGERFAEQYPELTNVLPAVLGFTELAKLFLRNQDILHSNIYRRKYFAKSENPSSGEYQVTEDE